MGKTQKKSMSKTPISEVRTIHRTEEGGLDKMSGQRRTGQLAAVTGQRSGQLAAGAGQLLCVCGEYCICKSHLASTLF